MRNNYFYLVLIVLASSCVPQRKMVYVQSVDEKAKYEYVVENQKNIRIEPFDQLYISIGSIDQQGYNFFSQEKQNFNSLSEQSLLVLGYTVNDSGCVNLPVIGKIKLQGQTMDEAEVTLKEATKNVLNQPIVSVRFVNNSITVLGEVLKPGNHLFTSQQLTIFRALGLAGDITEYGNRKKVVLIREKNRVIHKYHLDLTDDKIFKSDYYYLRPNDVLYVEPLKIRRFGMREYPFNLIVSSVTAFFLILYYVKK